MNSMLEQNQKNSLNAIKSIQIALLIVIITIISFGQIARWDLLDQIAMADRFHALSEFYPDKSEERPTGVSVYFPGVALLAWAASALIPGKFLVHAMLILACVTIVVFLLVQREIAKQIDVSYEGDNFWPLAIIFSLFFAREWLVYAAEFKPDTIAFLLGSIFVLLSRRSYHPSVSNLLSLLFGLLAGLVLIFKQQYIAFIVGYLVYGFYSRQEREVYFSGGCLVGAGVVVLLLKLNGDAWFWTITILSDDGFLGYADWIKDHLGFLLKLGAFPLACFIGRRYCGVTCLKGALSVGFFQCKSSPWPLIIVFEILAALFSSFKVGGNAGNTAFGIIMLLPVIAVFFSKINVKIFLIIGWLVIVFQVPKIIRSHNSYVEADELIDAVISIDGERSRSILTGSDVYLASRRKFPSHAIVNYWTISLRNNVNVMDGVEFGKLVQTSDFDYIIAENWMVNKIILQRSGKYDIFFENKLGIIAKLEK